jgi:hypothetical protein
MEYTTEKEGRAGELRKVSFIDKDLEIREVLENPQITLEWTWDTGVCPHCKNRITRNVTHQFYRIEIMVPTDIEDKDVIKTDIVLGGNTLDNRQMILPESHYNEILAKSKKYKHLIEVK